MSGRYLAGHAYVALDCHLRDELRNHQMSQLQLGEVVLSDGSVGVLKRRASVPIPAASGNAKISAGGRPPLYWVACPDVSTAGVRESAGESRL